MRLPIIQELGVFEDSLPLYCQITDLTSMVDEYAVTNHIGIGLVKITDLTPMVWSPTIQE
ncbi:5614_t:CDS:2 [Funneliformis caledonium]|uniref:5614_t:CDS:1 n=1 Tax=Funneliformis caledonium TaxID=1117310 RepID=A0A9N9BR85_9GLOM|nr:5614_t:CDS:2 [Funneliformis caledonium]